MSNTNLSNTTSSQLEKLTDDQLESISGGVYTFLLRKVGGKYVSRAIKKAVYKITVKGAARYAAAVPRSRRYGIKHGRFGRLLDVQREMNRRRGLR